MNLTYIPQRVSPKQSPTQGAEHTCLHPKAYKTNNQVNKDEKMRQITTITPAPLTIQTHLQFAGEQKEAILQN